MLELLESIFAEGLYIPHGHCYLWKPGLVWLHIASDSLIALAYYSIPLTLIYFVQKRRDLPFNWIFLLFGGFIIFCGTTHLMEIWTLWHPIYWISGFLKAFTAAISLCTAIVLVRIIPQALALPSPAQLEAANHQLEKAKEQLEIIVEERTTEIRQAIRRLQSEIEERKQIQEVLEQQKELLETIFDHIPVMVLFYHANGQIQFTNRQLERVLGWSEAELKDFDHLAECYPSTQYRQKVVDHMLAATGKWQDFKTRIRDRSYIDTSWANIQLSDGKCIGIGQDITERKQREEALRLIMEGTASATDSAFMLSCVRYLAQVLQVRYALIAEVVDEAYTRARTLAFWTGEAWGENFEYHLVDAPCETLLQGKQCFYPKNVQVLFPKDQNIAKLNAQSYLGIPLIDSDGRILGLLVVLDVKPMDCDLGKESILKIFAARAAAELKRKQAEEALRQSEAREREKAQELELTVKELQRTQAQLVLTEKMASLGQLVAGVAHEINNPTSFIYGNIEPATEYAENLLNLVELYRYHYPQPGTEITKKLKAIELDFIAEDFPKLLASIKEGANRISLIVQSLRNFSRLDQAKRKRVDIHEGIENTLLILQHRLKQQPERGEIQVIKEYGELPLVECHPDQLNQVFMNLLCNAIDAIEEMNCSAGETLPGNIKMARCRTSCIQNPQIRICTEVDENQSVMIRIADNGAGMSQEILEQLFNPFFTTKPVGRGTGLGLSISYQIVVEKHSGKLQCISTAGVGTEFLISIPVRQQDSVRRDSSEREIKAVEGILLG